ncbi:hypothetical protein [Calditerricola satsumensis]|uniref:Uncharacterized protein n=1 Tax=Calditerricola satsumensis TaxID=373054 RepID=A0A8J3B937_9BACI|nr:hypothetical protein [Calditerricola satsumensis]GGK04383.1 hypothetical protein GCM10007043_18050 [Calditerricola satsumensis]
MISEITVIGVVMVLVGLIRSALERVLPPPVVKQYIVPLLVLGLAAVFNALNAWVFVGPTAVKEALVRGIELGAQAAGIYSLGKAVLGKS